MSEHDTSLEKSCKHLNSIFQSFPADKHYALCLYDNHPWLTIKSHSEALTGSQRAFLVFTYTCPIPLRVKRLKTPHTRYKSHFMSGGHPHTHHFLLQYTMFYVLMQCICIKKCIKKASRIKCCQLKFILIYVYHFSKYNIFDLCIAFFIFKRTSLIFQLTAL